MGRVVALCQQVSRESYGFAVEASDLRGLLTPLLLTPRNMWLAAEQKIVTRRELISFLAAHIQTFLVHRSSVVQSPDPLMRDIESFSLRLEEALFGEAPKPR